MTRRSCAGIIELVPPRMDAPGHKCQLLRERLDDERRYITAPLQRDAALPLISALAPLNVTSQSPLVTARSLQSTAEAERYARQYGFWRPVIDHTIAQSLLS